MTTFTKERLLTIKQWRETYGPGSNVVLPAEEAEELARIALASLEREQIRHEHAKWSDSTFGCVGPIGPLKHLSKEALEAAAEPDDLSEWADMQFLLWDAQRRAGISDAEITA
ncbi:dATP/dGTP pyrophosphohydrolase domain-containing protein, partial [Escherichia coli]|uniref:dATP/dGTP pyrophosphohydrolase domain-containing protein n=1 Tax=Escherichia coli TaxID=562 RepID=UPI0010CC06BD